MRYVVTGASGHIGSNLVRHLLHQGHDVRVLCFRDSTYIDGLPVERVDGDVRDPASLRAAIADREILVHLAAIISIDQRDHPLMQATNVEGVRNVAEVALESGIRRMIHVSSTHAYETWRIGRPLDETGAKCEGPPHPGYDCSKAAGEKALREVIARGLDAVILNPSGVIGPLDHRPSHIGRVLQHLYRGWTPMVPRGGFVWVDVREILACISNAVEHGRRGENYLLGSEYATIKDFAGIIASTYGWKDRVIEFDPSLLRPLVGLSRIASSITGGRRSFTRDTFHALTSELELDTSKAREELGFKPRPLRETVADTLSWYIERGVLPARKPIGG